MPKGWVCVRLGSHFLVIASLQVEGGAKVCSWPVVRVRRRSLEDRNRRKADTDRPATNDCNGSIAGRHERPLMGTSGLSRCPIKSAVRRQIAHSLKPSPTEMSVRTAPGRKRPPRLLGPTDCYRFDLPTHQMSSNPAAGQDVLMDFKPTTAACSADSDDGEKLCC